MREIWKKKAARSEIATVAQIKQDYEELVGQTVHKTTIYRLLKRHQWRKIVPRQSHPKANQQEQEAFKKTSNQQVEKILQTKEAEDSRPVLLMAADEGRFGRLGEVRACWCPPEIRPIIPKQQVREYVYAYAAVAPELGQMSCLVLPYANTKMMNLFLKQVSEDFREYLIIMQVDKAAGHRSKSLEIPENIRLLTQPSYYSPELMPVEHLWEYLRENYFNNRIFQSIFKVVDELCRGLVELGANMERLRSMTYFPHLRIHSLNAT